MRCTNKKYLNERIRVFFAAQMFPDNVISVLLAVCFLFYASTHSFSSFDVSNSDVSNNTKQTTDDNALFSIVAVLNK